jgi:glycosyltransferase involved in cell wall biosynthesis
MKEALNYTVKMRNVLFVVYEFPPEGARGTKRAMKFISYLPTHGWKPVILTVKNGNYDFHDGSLLSEIPTELKIYRAITMESLFYKTGDKKDEVVDVKLMKSSANGVPLKRRILRSFYHLLGRGFSAADSRVLWIPFALKAGRRIIGEEKIDAIFASGPSFTNHLVAMLLKKMTKKPLILDFRDAWASDPAGVWRSARQKRLTGMLESKAVMAADRVVSTTEGITLDFIERYAEPGNKFVTITNGFDRGDFESLYGNVRRSKDGVFKIVHVGTLGWERSPKEFIVGLGELVREKPDMKGKIQVIFVGQNTPFKDGKTIHDYILEWNLSETITVTGFVARIESLKYMIDSDLLLLIIGKVPDNKGGIYGISAKMYDYALAGKPVMTIADEGASAEMVRFLRLGIVIPPDDKGMIKSEIINYYDRFKSGGLNVEINSEALDSFDFKNLTARLAGCFDDLVGID